MVRIIVVEPFAEGWAVSQPTIANPQIFVSGAKAEDAAIRLGASLAEAGETGDTSLYARRRPGGEVPLPAGGVNLIS